MSDFETYVEVTNMSENENPGANGHARNARARRLRRALG